MAKKPDDPDGPWVKSLRELSSHFPVSYKTVATSWRQAGMPGTPGRWGIGQVRRWYEERHAGHQNSAASKESTDDKPKGWDIGVIQARQKAEMRLKTAKADEAEFNLRKMRGEFYEVVAINQWWSECLIATREEALRITTDLRPQLPRGEIGDRILEEVRRRIESFLTRMSGWRPSTTEE
jgi:phage terminase Nu1 subunit (DNA packaging protein)